MKRNVYPLTTMTTARLLRGTFGWTITEFPTSLDLVFNQASASGNLSTTTKLCDCENSPLFTIDSSICCDIYELQNITTPHHMLSNFVVSYFFKILAQSFRTILYTKFLFDFVKRDGGWNNFVSNSTTEGHYTTFLEALTQKDKVCIIPICDQVHWTILVQKFTGNAWTIFFADSLLHGSDQRLTRWKALF